MNLLASLAIAQLGAGALVPFWKPVPSARAAEGTQIAWLRSPGASMIRVPAGRFVFGSTTQEILQAAASCAAEPLGHRCTEQTFANELGRRVSFQPSFWLDRTEVTVREYARCVAAAHCLAPVWGADRFDHPDYPVTFVTFHDAEAFCRFRGSRLPSEAEFERAARGTSGRTYPWGDLYNARVANHGSYAPIASDPSDGYAELAPVGAFPDGRTPDGILDLAGNVAEWVSDPYRERYADPVPAANEASRRTVRGGSWRRGAAWLRGAAREGVPPDLRRPDLGFRCARSAHVAEGGPP